MSIRDIWAKIKAFLEDDRAFVAVLLIAVAFASFGLGRLSMEGSSVPATVASAPKIQKSAPHTSTEVTAPASSTVQPEPTHIEDQEPGYVGSKNGTKYHLPWCSGAKRIAEENLIRFETKEEAEAKGYTPAANCPGL